MIRKFGLLLAILMTMMGAALYAAPSATAECTSQQAGGDPFFCACGQNSDATKNAVACKDQTGDDPVTGKTGVLEKVRTIIAVAGGIIAVIIIVISGFKFVTANGDASKVANARTTLLYALIGVAIIIIAAGIISFVLRGARG